MDKKTRIITAILVMLYIALIAMVLLTSTGEETYGIFDTL